MFELKLLKSKLLACLIHFIASLFLVLPVALFFLNNWYPWPYAYISGGLHLLGIIVAVDVFLGPLITFVLFNRKKSVKEQRLDLSLVVVLQVIGLLYGLWSLFQASPMYLVFEYDRFRVVHRSEVDPERTFQGAVYSWRPPLKGPNVLSLRKLAPDEQFDRTMLALQGLSLSMQSELWQSYEQGLSEVATASLPISTLLQKFPQYDPEVGRMQLVNDLKPSDLVYLPVLGRDEVVWTVIMDVKSGDLLGYLPVDSF